MHDTISNLLSGFKKNITKVNDVDIAYVTADSSPKDAPALLLLHGFPQTHVMWHPIAHQLAKTHNVVCADLRGYGDSEKPVGSASHIEYSKREMAKDMATLMQSLGHDTFQVVAHDRGARVAHRLCLDHPDRVTKAIIMDIIPTLTYFDAVNQQTAEAYYHWFFLSQAKPYPEDLIGNSKQAFMDKSLGGLGSGLGCFHKDAVAEYQRCFTDETIHSICEDYRAATTIDLEHDRADFDTKIECPTLILWGEKGFMHGHFDFIEAWREKAHIVTGHSINAGHFLVEEAPKESLKAILGFLD